MPYQKCYPGSRKALRIAGIVLLAAGILLVILLRRRMRMIGKKVKS